MRLAVSDRIRTSRQRGSLLRCFLDPAWKLLVLCAAVCSPLHAQLDVSGPIHLTHVDGQVANSQGKPVANVEVSLVQNDKVAFSTKTDESGAFEFEHVSGKYWFRVARSDYAPAAREIEVRDEIVTYLRRKKLYVIVGPSACMDECSSVLTSKRDFERAIRKKSRH